MIENKKPPFKISVEHLRNLAKEARIRFKENLKKSQEFSKTAIQNFDPQAAINWTSQALQKRGTSFYGTMATIILSTFFVANLTALLVGEYIPTPPPASFGRMGGASARQKSITDYSAIITRNLFNSQGIIPGEEKLGSGADSSTADPGGPPIKSGLPLTLIGTLILEDELRSIATIEDKAATAVYPVRVEDEIPDKLKVLKIDPMRVTFLNKASGRREFLELPDENPGNPRISVGRNSDSGGAPGIEKLAPTQYNVSRSEVDKTLADFNNILTQARAVPNIENGVPSGYKLFQIVPGSIYDKLGLQNGDVVSGLNGNPINDPAKAFEMLSELKTSNHMELQVKKDGKSLTYTYDIH